MDKRFDTNEAAAYLGVKPKTLWEWRNRTPIPLPCYRISKRRFMYLKSDLDNYLAQCRIDIPCHLGVSND
ncbi:helix-turn-helix transcriptional regulator [Legionella israelensis]|uniref:Helix-turn-helix domain protein n=1 Tax=Legionella israelensis TaxID=454 RepID=A0A0W0V1I5_9GAMM|nr:helix-turn-helix domain-containing protein [Legionella israelensis]KTD13973.1 Helix-turn-helix domain protein [Legionella israelensis]SCY37071.1 Helix-turn-helix domain-containing protein [Legionella israelensis DSM 19235]STX60563.1 Helix-turn-helix domain [Legionella israelensis]